MKKAINRISVVFLGLAVIMLSMAFAVVGFAPDSSQNLISYAEFSGIVINDFNVGSLATSFAGGDGSSGNPYQIATAGQMVKAMKEGSACYILTDDVLFTSTTNLNWQPVANFTGTFDGDDHTITYEASTNTGTANYGLFASNSGTIKNIDYEFTGAFTYSGAGKYGSLVGYNQNMGIIDGCTVSMYGSITVTGSSDGQTVIAGGAIGQNAGTIRNSVFETAGNVKTETYSDSDEDHRGTIVYSGGVIGYNNGYIEYCQIEVSGTIEASNTTYMDRVLGLWASGNYSSALFASGGVIGFSSGGSIMNSQIASQGSIAAMGNEASTGAAGGIAGASDSSFTIQNSVLTLGSVIQAYSALQDETLYLYDGGIVGRLSSAAGSFSNNVVKFAMSSGNLLSANYKGAILGSGDFDTWEKGNVWLVYDIRSGVGDFVGTGATGTTYNQMDVRGSGSVGAEIEASTGNITLLGIPGYSPLYGWMSTASSNTPISGTKPSGVNGYVSTDGSGEYYPAASLTGARYEALFFKQELNQAGDLNVLSDLTAAGANFSWMSVTLENDVTATGAYTPIGNETYEYQGTFDGQGNKITYISSAIISGKDFAGIFGIIGTNGEVRDLEIAFGGTITADNLDPATDLFGSPVPRDTDVKVGLVAGINKGIISNISITTSSGSEIIGMQETAGRYAAVGGVVGRSESAGTLQDVNIDIQGKVHARIMVSGAITYAGGLIGILAVRPSGVFTSLGYMENVSVAIEGEVACQDREDTGTATYCGGLVGYNIANSDFVVVNGAVAIKKTGIFGNAGVGGQGTGTNNVGALSSYCSTGSTTMTLENVWVIMDASEQISSGMRIFGNDADTNADHEENRLYIDGGIVQAEIESNGQVSMAVPIGAGEIFAGWYQESDYTGLLKTEAQGVYDNVYKPSMSFTSTRRYTKVITSLIKDYDEFSDVAHFTNQGNDFSGIEFILGAEINLGSSFIPIGYTDDTKFNGTFNGGNLQITVSGINYTTVAGEAPVAGVFGYLGEDAHIYAFNIYVTGNISQSSSSAMYAAGLVAYNEGTIGLNSPSQKTIVTIGDGGKVQALFAGGIVGYNDGLLYNVEVIVDGGVIEAGNLSSVDTCAGGAIAVNAGIAKNIKVQILANAFVQANGSARMKAAGGVALNNGSLYSVAVILRESIYVNGSGLKYSGGVVGLNNSTYTDCLWMVADDPEIMIDNTPEGTPEYGVQAGANLLQIYGPGAIEVTVEANTAGDTSGLGGMIIFKSVTTEDSGTRTFYGYMYDLEAAVLLDNSVGVSDYIFTPIGLTGINVYSIFALSKITNFTELAQMSSDVNNDINPKIIYNLNANITISSAFTPIGTEEYPFNGVFKGNQHTITFANGSTSISGLFGYVGEGSKIEFLNVTLTKDAQIFTGANVGAIASANYGTISNVNVTLNRTLQASGSAGGIAGVNYGTISTAVVYMNYTVISGVIHAGNITGGNAAGGIAGTNYLNVGSAAVQDIKVIFQSGATISTTNVGSNVGGVVGNNTAAGVIRNAFMTINGNITTSAASTSAGGIAGKNAGMIHTIFVLIEGTGTLANATNIGLVAGTNSGIIGLSDGNYNNINAGIYKAITGQVVGGAVGIMTEGYIYNVFMTIEGNLTGTSFAGGLVGKTEQPPINHEAVITDILLTLNSGNYINSESMAGGLIGENHAKVFNVKLELDGVIKCVLSGGSVASESSAGGAFGENYALITNMIIILGNDVIAENKGSVAGKSGLSLGINVWALMNNRIATPVCSDENSGYNSLKIVGDASLSADFNESYVITFEVLSSTESLKEWYADISGLDSNIPDILTGNMVDENTFTPYTNQVNCSYHACFYTLSISNEDELKEVANYINQHDYFNGVRFYLTNNVQIQGSIVPIGTLSHPFHAIFDGCGRTITFNESSSIGSVKYSGLFGYTSEASKINNLIMNVAANVVIGGQGATYTGALVGYSNGAIINVLVNLASTPRAGSSSNVGGFAGYMNPSTTAINSWLIVHNASCPASANSYTYGATRQQYGINVMNIVGSGVINADFISHSDPDAYQMQVPDTQSTFNDWFEDISNPDPNDHYPPGTIKDEGFTYLPVLGLSNSAFAASFIQLTISNYQELRSFSSNINTYSGFAGVKFTLTNNIVINTSAFVPVGTKTHPFSGIFEGNGYSISFAGISVYGSYPGLFGYVDSDAEIMNLIVISNTTDTENAFGDENAIYSGLLASYCDGSLENVIGQVKSNTTIFCINKAGGLIGSTGSNFHAVKAWVILPENSTLNAAGVAEGQINILYTAGKGSIRLQIISSQVTFTATPDGTTDPFYGYICDSGLVDANYTLTPSPTLLGVRYTAIFLNATIRSYSDLQRLSEIINEGLNYSGVVYNLITDISIDNSYIPIGGLVGSKIVKFKGTFNGNGHTITIPAGVTVTGAYAGIFGYVDSMGAVMNLKMNVQGSTGNSLTLYAGNLIAYNEGAIENIAIHISKESTVTGASGVSGFVGYTTTPAENAWLVNYNSKSIMDRNNAGRTYGHNTFTILGAGELSIDFMNAEANNYTVLIAVLDDTYLTEWYYYDESVKTELQAPSLTSYTANPSLTNSIYYVSFLNTELTEYAELLKLAEDINLGYDFYGISINLNADITIQGGFPGIGGEGGQFSASFNGNNYTITLPAGISITGYYAGIFGYINEYGSVTNLKVQLDGTLGNASTRYAGTFAYNAGRIENTVVVGYSAVLNTDTYSESYKGTVIGYDVNSLILNTWGVIASYNNIKAVGIKSTGVNKMKVVGIGRITSEIMPDNSIVFANDEEFYSETAISGWYRNYSTGAIISNYLGIGTVSEDLKSYTPASTVANAEYEVIIIKNTISNETELNVLANDINIGGYDFKNVTFNVNANFTLSSNILLGTESSPFRGVFNGSGYTITIMGSKGIFGYNEGTIKNLDVVVASAISAEAEAAAIAYVNDGTINACSVTVNNGASISGVTVGAITALNNGTVSGISSANILPSAVLQGLEVGGAIGITNGTVKDVEVTVSGSIIASGAADEDAYAGGLVGYVREGVSSRMVAYVYEDASITANSDTAYAGGLLGRNRSMVKDSVLFGSYNTVSALGDTAAAGEFAGISSSNMTNSWMVMPSHTGTSVAVGNGPKSINILTVYGNGGVKLNIDRTHGNLLFYKDDSYTTSVIDGWYVSKDMLVSENPNLGNISASGDDYAPSADIMGRSISVVFINTVISDYDDLLDLADAVNGGMTSKYIEFALANDITLNQALPESIGLAGKEFNYVFNGAGHALKIYYEASGTNSCIFGYIGSSGVIYNLNIEVYNTIGSADTIYAGALAAENEGEIRDCSVTIAGQGKIIANTAGGLIGRNYNNGSVKAAEINIIGSVEATGAVELNRAGGVAGRNDGLITLNGEDYTVVTVQSTGSIYSYGVETPYAGGIAGQNAGAISYSKVLSADGHITAAGTGPYNSFAGGVTGSNTGTIRSDIVYASDLYITASGIKYNYAAGITGVNKNVIDKSVIYIDNASGISGSITDTAVAYDDSGAVSLITNTWVFGSSDDAISSNASLNNILEVEPNTELNLNEAAFVLGTLSFTITQVSGYFAVYDNITDPNVKQVYLNNINKNVFTPAISSKGIKASARNSCTISSGSELKAFAQAVNNDTGILTTATIDLAEDIIISGDYDSVGNVNYKLAGTFRGNSHTITVAEDTVFTGAEPGGITYASVFGFVNAVISDVIIRIEGDFAGYNKAAPLAVQNYNSISKCVVYLTDGSMDGTASDSTTVIVNTGTLTDMWTITSDVSLVPAFGRVIHVRGEGAIDTVIGATVIEFTALEAEDNYFGGWYYDNSLLSTVRMFSSVQLTDSSYTVEFVSALIGSQADLANIARLMPMGFITDGLIFTQYQDFEITGSYSPVGTAAAPFMADYDGAGYAIVMDELTISGMNAGMFGNIGDNGSVSNLVLVLGNISAPMALTRGGLAALSSGNISSVAVYGNAAYNLIVGSDDGSVVENVWYVTDSETAAAGIAAGTVLISGPGIVLTEIDAVTGIITMTADTAMLDGIFAGWFEDGSLLGFEPSIDMPEASEGVQYDVIFITSKISNEDEYADFANAVTLGFDLLGETVTLTADITLSSAVIAGSAEHAFAGTFDGDGYSITTGEDYAGDYASLFTINQGLIKNLIVYASYNIGTETSLYAATIAGINEGSIQNVSAIFDAELDGASVGGLAASGSGTITNSWFITNSTASASGAEGQGGKMTFSGCEVTAELTAGEFTFTAIAETPGKFIVWYTEADYSAAVTDGNELNGYTPAASINGVEYAVRETSVISILGELLAFAAYVNSGDSFLGYTISLGADIIISGCDYSPIGGSAVNTFEGIFSGEGYTITIAEDMTISGDYSGLFGVNDGTIENLIVVLEGTVAEGGSYEGVVVALNNGTIENTAVFIGGSAASSNAVAGRESTGTLVNCWYILLPEVTGWVAGEPANCITLMGSGSIEASIEADILVFTAVAPEDVYFAGWTTGTVLDDSEELDTSTAPEDDYTAEFLDLNIEEEEDLINLARLIETYDFDAAALVFEVLADIETTEDFVSIGTSGMDFAGTINGNFHTVNLNTVDEDNFDGFIAYGDGASINALAFSRDTGFDSFGGNVIVNSGTAIMENVVLMTPVASMAAGSSAELIIVGDTGDLTTGYATIAANEEETAFIVTAVPNSEDDYDFRGFYDSLNVRLENDTYNYIVPSAGSEVITLKFHLRYRVTFTLNGILQGEAAINTPTLSGAGYYWLGEDDVTLEVTDIGDGYLFRGIRLAAETDYLSTTTFTYTFAAPAEHQAYVADFELISFAYLSMVYNADRQEQEVSNEDLDGLSIIYTYEGIDGTEYSESTDAPINVGKYKVTAELSNLSLDVIGRRTVGYTITPAPLTITVLNILDKDYDTTADAEINGGYEAILFSGLQSSIYRTDTSSDISLELITFAFASANAGTWNIIVKNNALSAGTGTPDTYMNYWFGTQVGEVVYKGVVPTAVMATINPLAVSVMATTDITKTYGEPDPELTYEFLEGSNQPFPGDDFTGALSRESGENVGIYKIIRGTLNLSANYTLSVYTTGAELTIIRRIVTITINPANKQYGDTDPVFTYTDISTDAGTGLVNSDRLTLVWDYPKNALPSETPYRVEALFNPVTNANYDIVSPLQRSVSGITCKYLEQNVFTVNKRDVRVAVAGNNSKVYGSADLVIRVTFTNNLIGDNVYATRSAGENTGTYSITYKVLNSSLDVTSRYNIVYVNGTGYSYTITPKPIYVTPGTVSVTYGEEGVSNIPWTAVLPDGVSLDDINGTLARESGDTVGQYDVEIGTLTVNNSNYELVIGAPTPYVITSRTLTVTITDAATKVYGEADPDSVEFLVTGFAEGDTATEILLDSLLRVVSGDAVGSYSITGDFIMTGATSGNYSLNIVDGLLTVTPKPITISTGNVTMTYGAKAPAVAYELVEGQLVDADTLASLGLSFADFSKMDAGTYQLAPETISNGNYLVTTEPGTLTINKRRIKVEAVSTSKVKGEEDPEIEYDADKLYNGAKFKGSLGREEGESAGIYLITEGDLRINDPDNYELVFDLEDATFTIERAPISFVPIAIAGGGGIVFIGGAIALFTILRKLKIARIPI